MHIKLKNFRCYTEKDFDFGDEGLVLLSGQSGAGKTTILQAITFALYGTGTKLVMFGKTSCKVELTFEDIKITRTKRPNRVVVTNIKTCEEYEDDSAQSIINERFGNAFDVTSYVQQNPYKSFIMMSPLEKLGFLEKFAFQGIDLSKLKGKCKSVIQKRNEELISTTSKLDLATQHYKSLEKPKKIDFPLKKTKDKEKAIKNEEIKYKNTLVYIKRVKKDIQKLEKERNDLQILQVKIDSHNSNISKISTKLEEIEKNQNLDYEGDEKLALYEKKLQVVLDRKKLSFLQEKYLKDKERIELLKQEENERNEKRIQNLKNKLWKEYTEEEADETISDYESITKDSQKYERLKYDLQRYLVDEKKLKQDTEDLEECRNNLQYYKDLLAKLVLQKETYTCPSCKTALRLHSGKLSEIEELEENSMSVEEDEDEDEIRKKIVKLSEKISRFEYDIPQATNNLKLYKESRKKMKEIESNYEDEIPSYDEVKDSIEYLQTYKFSQKELEKQIKELEENEDLPDMLNSLIDDVARQRQKIKSIKKQLKIEKDDCDNEIELREKIQEQTRIKQKIHDLQRQKENLQEELEEEKQEIIQLENEHKREYSEIKVFKHVNFAIEDENVKLSEYEKDAEKHARNLELIEKYKQYRVEKDRYKEWKTKVKDLEKEEIEKRHLYAAATMLKDKILEAESIAILNIINSINAHAQEFLEIFFPTNPICVQLLPFKKTKKNIKPQINLQIDYKGMEADVGMLSGGEISRVVLAFTLALSEIFNSPLLLLDECTASIDQNLTSVVIDGIHRNFGSKIVIVIAHQIVEGNLDKVIKIE